MATRRTVLAGIAATAAGAIARPARAQSKPIPIGALISSENIAPYDAQMRLGLNLAIDEVNAAGGVFGRPLSLVVRDDFGDPSAATSQAIDMIERAGVEAIVTGFLQTTRVILDETLQGIPIPLLHAVANEGQYCSKNLLHFGPTTAQALRPLLADLADIPDRKYFVISEATRAQQFVLSRVLQATRPAVVGMSQLPPGTSRAPTDFSASLRRARDVKANVILSTMTRPSSGILVKQAIDHKYADGLTFAFLDYSEAQATDLPEGIDVRACVSFAASDERPAVQAFVARAAVRSAGGLVTHIAFSHYNAVMAFVEAMNRAGRPSGQAAVGAMANLSLQTATGTLAFGRSGYANMPMVTCRAEPGRLRVSGRLDAVEAAASC